VELGFDNSTVLIDVGLPLDHKFDDDIDSSLPQPVFRQLKHGKKKVDGVLLSHAHLDHYGLAGILPFEIPVYCGEASAELISITAKVNSGKKLFFEPKAFKAWKTFRIGAFSVTPYLMDHSAFDAYGFLVSAGGKNVFYTGDFRGHGRKAKLLDRLVQNPPEVDVLLMEGTLVGQRSAESTVTEAQLEQEFAKIIEETRGIVLITTSSQNIDRLVTIFKATKRTGRRLIIDFYTAEVLGRLEKYAQLPQASWPRIRVCYPQLLARRFEEAGLDEILVRHRENGIRWSRIKEVADSVVMLVRPGFLYDLKRFINLDGAVWIYSMWRGYFEQSKPLRNLKGYLEDKGIRFQYLHTSGHAKLSDMTRLVEALNPEMVVPIHSFHPEKYKDHFPKVRLVNDGETVELG
jgi:ribonuclease J